MRLTVTLIALAVMACKTDAATIPDATSDSMGGDVIGDTAPDTTDSGDSTAETTQDTADTSSADTDETTADTNDDTDSAGDTTGSDTNDTTAADTDDDTADTTDTSGADADTDTTDTASCGADEDCQNCTWGQPVASVDDCYCPLCPSYPLSKTECTKNQADWETHCSTWAETNPCPVPRCLVTAAPLCDEGQCIANPNGCFESDDCGTCRFPTAPKSPSDCACPTCPAPANITHCEAIENAIAEHCSDFDFESCPLPNCPRPPAIGCTSERVCGYGDLLPEER
ncbi:MAG TPA: hypothetical protein PK095_03925 [Myxococcota bacterium]|nr:hypothetical protein [Myxococcota bacterium]